MGSVTATRYRSLLLSDTLDYLDYKDTNQDRRRQQAVSKASYSRSGYQIVEHPLTSWFVA